MKEHSIAHKRKESLVMQAVSEIVTEELTNSNISYPTVTSVYLSNDLSTLEVYLTFESNEERSLEAISKTAGFVKKKLANKVSLRKLPNIIFKIDESIASGRRIDEILKKIKDKDENNN